jgi:hypothetical protein
VNRILLLERGGRNLSLARICTRLLVRRIPTSRQEFQRDGR